MDEMPGRFPPPPDSGPHASPPGWGPPPDQQGWQTPPPGFYPLDIGRIFGLTFSIFRFRWRTLVGVALLIMVPVSAIVAVANAYQISSPDWMSQFSDLSAAQQFDAYWNSLWTSLPLSIGYGLIVGILSYIGNGAITDAAARTFVGSPVGALASVRRSLGKFITFGAIYLVIFLVEVVLVAVGVAVGAALFLPSIAGGRVVGGPAVFLALIVFVALAAVLIFLTIRWSLAAQAVMIESAGAMTALRRSWHLVSGSAWRVLGYILGFGILVGLIAAVLSVIITLLLNPIRIVGLTQVSIDPVRLAIATFIAGVIAGTLIPIPTIATTLLYYDLRFRKGEKAPEPGLGSVPEQ
jgi:hypothetical protein